MCKTSSSCCPCTQSLLHRTKVCEDKHLQYIGLIWLSLSNLPYYRSPLSDLKYCKLAKQASIFPCWDSDLSLAPAPGGSVFVSADQQEALGRYGNLGAGGPIGAEHLAEGDTAPPPWHLGKFSLGTDSTITRNPTCCSVLQAALLRFAPSGHFGTKAGLHALKLFVGESNCVSESPNNRPLSSSQQRLRRTEGTYSQMQLSKSSASYKQIFTVETCN